MSTKVNTNINRSSPKVATPSSNTKYTLKFWSILILTPVFLAGGWKLWQHQSTKSLIQPGFVDLGLMKRDLQSGEIIQLKLVIRTENPKRAKALMPYRDLLRQILVTTTGEANKETLWSVEGKLQLKKRLEEQFIKALQPSTAELIEEVLYSEFLIT